jgi:hypothetical protein
VKVLSSNLRVRGVARLVGYASVALLLLSAALARASYESLSDGQLRVGQQLDSAGGLLSAPRTVSINGAIVNLTVALTDQSPEEVLDRYEAICESHPELSSRAMSDIAWALRGARPGGLPVAKLPRGVLRSEAHGDGALTCFAGDRPFSLGELPAHIRAFEASGDLSAIGHLRYVFAKKVGAGSFVRTVWSDGPVNLARMFPAAGDADGFDSSLVPRPFESRRVLSASSSQLPDTIHVYETRETEDAVRGYYAREMSARGWAPLGQDAKATAVYRSPQGALLFSSFSSRDGLTTVTATVSGGEAPPSLAQLRDER